MKQTRFSGSRTINPAVRQRGASLLEGIAYLGIAAIVILGAISLLMSAFGGAESNRLVEEVTAIRTSVKKLYMGQSASYGTGLLNGDLASVKAFPTTLAVSTSSGATTVKNSWNGDVKVTGVTGQFTISYELVPQDVCINAVSGSSGWAKVQVGSATPIAVFPVTPAVATSNCSGSTNTITWTAS